MYSTITTTSTSENLDKRTVYLDKNVYSRWCSVGVALGVSPDSMTDSMIASFLIGQYEKIHSGVLSDIPCPRCQHLVTLVCSWCDMRTQAPVTQDREVFTSEHSDKGTIAKWTDQTEVCKDVDVMYRQEIQQDPHIMASVSGMTSAASQEQKVALDVNQMSVEKKYGSSLINVRLGSINACILRTQSGNSMNSAFVCAECNASFKTQECLLEHGQLVHGLSDPQKNNQVLFCCSSCEEIFTSKRSLDKHEQTHHSSESQQVTEESECTVTFSSDVFPKTLKKKCSKKNSLVCTKCVTSFTSVVPFKRHMRSHGVTRPFDCDKCNASFKTRAYLKVHDCIKKHSVEESAHSNSANKPEDKSQNSPGEQANKYECQECGKVFTCRVNLKNHTLRFHPTPENKPHICEICGREYPFKSALQRHLKLHKGEKPHVCEFCNAAFLYSTSLNRHKQIHAADRTMSMCEVCGASFANPYSLKNHMRVHTGERPFKCSFCDASFRLSCILQKHERMHKDERKYVCSICGRAFTEREYWRSHMRTHTGEKPFVCSICGAGFAQKGSLNAHKKRHSTTKDEIGAEFPLSHI